MRRALAAAALLLAAWAAPARGQAPLCAAGDSVRTCFSREVLGMPARVATDSSAAVAAAVDGEAEDLDEAGTGPNVSSTGAATSISDFLPRLSAALLTPQPSEGPGALALKLNLPLNDGVLLNLGATGQVEVAAHEAQPSEALLDSVPETLRSAVRDRLSKALGSFDDVSLTGRLNFENRRMGRSLRPHQRDIDAVARQLVGAGSGDLLRERAAAQRAFLLFVAAMPARLAGAAPGCAPPAHDGGAVPVSCLSGPARDTLETVVQQARRAYAAWKEAADAAVASSGFDRVSELLNNQPQLHVAFTARVRDRMAGPGEWQVSARYEMGLANLNGLRRTCGGTLSAECLRAYTRNEKVRGSLDRGDRLWVEASFVRRGAYDVALAGDSAALDAPASSGFAASGGYGAYIGDPSLGERRDRADLTLRYDHTRDDPLRQDRFVASLFFTRRLSDSAGAVLGVTFANRPEMLADADRRFGAHIGFTYKVDNGADDRDDGGAGGDGGG